MTCFLRAAAIPAMLLALSGHASATVITFDEDKGALRALQFSLWPSNMDGIWMEAGYDIAFNGYPIESDEYGNTDFLGDSLKSALYHHAFMSDCSHCFSTFTSLDSLTISRFYNGEYRDPRPFSLDAVDISGSYSAYFGEFSFSPAIGSDSSAEYYSLPLLQKNMQITGTRADGSTVRTVLSTFEKAALIWSGDLQALVPQRSI